MASDKVFIVAVDGSKASHRALDHTIMLAQALGARVHLIHVVHWSGYVPIGVEDAYHRPLDRKKEEKHAKEDIIAPAMDKLREAGVEADNSYTWGNPAQEIKKKAQKLDADMIIVGRKGRSNIAEMIVGSVSNAIAHIAPVPVLLVP
ncbi:hypothetical protein CCR80_02785 [Rhodothalassium salexigens]|uniref:universal stress protein n=1 Tax=Rhodothalassium salexigens TaxID=1086 RepID=UPI0019128353|nr:universal stress protein [Rhodothalassium salexigens]MBK5919964.1 hypothetical protein [Rhodothalassium salexigens]